MFIFAVRWCGPGNSSTPEHPFGFLTPIDKCCDVSSVKGKSAKGLTTHTGYTISSCECDYNFIKCLKSINTVLANQIGNIYTSAVTKCIGVLEPSVCIEVDANFQCIRYALYSTLFGLQPQTRFYQFVDLPDYTFGNIEILRKYFINP